MPSEPPAGGTADDPDHLDDSDEVGLWCFHRLMDEMVYPAPLTPDFRSFLKEQILGVTTGSGTNTESW